ncbi:hypothetical protein RhiirA1_465120 [Rhizophagus irregularis]|uniref:Uncharacterized protein n=2 Tax=Rhizophagus irregularis TaxID=588596 RepID=A0A2N0RGK8_9GLOM|nr:hypothetical protein RhiirA1_465120 [Rhizophagus irregularis]
MIITNNRHIVKKYDKPFKTSSDRTIMNTKYRISKYLTSVFCGLPIDLNARNKYFCRIRQLLLDKLVAIENRLKKQEKNRQTTTYIKFSYGKRTWKVCQNCRSKVIVTPTPPMQNTFKNYCQSKQIVSKRISVTYTKKVSMDSGTGNYLVTYSNLGINKQFKTMKEQEKYKKRFTNSLKNHKNKWNYTNNRFESKPELEFLLDQVTSRSGYNMLKEDIFINHSFNSEYFLELRKKKEAAFECEDIKVVEQSSSAGKNTIVDNITTNFQELEIREQDNVLPWQEILHREIPITRPEFHRGLNSVRDLKTLMTYCNGVRNKRLAYKLSYNYVIGQCEIRARKIHMG